MDCSGAGIEGIADIVGGQPVHAPECGSGHMDEFCRQRGRTGAGISDGVVSGINPRGCGETRGILPAQTEDDVGCFHADGALGGNRGDGETEGDHWPQVAGNGRAGHEGRIAHRRVEVGYADVDDVARWIERTANLGTRVVKVVGVVGRLGRRPGDILDEC